MAESPDVSKRSGTLLKAVYEGTWALDLKSVPGMVGMSIVFEYKEIFVLESTIIALNPEISNRNIF